MCVQQAIKQAAVDEWRAKTEGCPCGPVVRAQHLPCCGLGSSLVWELRPSQPHGGAKREEKVMWCVCTIEYDSVTKKDGITSFAGTRMDPEMTIRVKSVRQRKRNSIWWHLHAEDETWQETDSQPRSPDCGYQGYDSGESLHFGVSGSKPSHVRR